MSLRDAIDVFATGTYTVTRTAASTYVNGREVTGATTTFKIAASIQPLQGRIDGRVLQVLAEGRHTNNIRVVFTKTALRSISAPDKVTIDGELWEVFAVERWEAFGPSGTAHYECFISRLALP